jgi:hypothetical protein
MNGKSTEIGGPLPEGLDGEDLAENPIQTGGKID